MSHGARRAAATRRLLAALGAAAALASCGKADGLSGAVEVPDGYEIVRHGGVSFAVPSGFRRQRTSAGDREVEVRYADPAAAGAYVPHVSLRVRPASAAEFEREVGSLVALFEALGHARIEADDLKVPGARRARRLTVEVPSQPGGNRSTIRAATIVVVRDGELVSLAAGAPEDREDRVDADAVVNSLRVGGGARDDGTTPDPG